MGSPGGGLQIPHRESVVPTQRIYICIVEKPDHASRVLMPVVYDPNKSLSVWGVVIECGRVDDISKFLPPLRTLEMASIANVGGPWQTTSSRFSNSCSSRIGLSGCVMGQLNKVAHRRTDGLYAVSQFGRGWGGESGTRWMVRAACRCVACVRDASASHALRVSARTRVGMAWWGRWGPTKPTPTRNRVGWRA